MMRQLTQRERECHPGRKNAQRKPQPANRRVVQEDQHERRQQEDHRQQRVGHHAGHLVPHMLEGHGAHRQLPGGEAAEEVLRLIEHAIPNPGAQAGAGHGLHPHHRHALQDERHPGETGQQRQRDRHLGEEPRRAARNHAIHDVAQEDGRREHQQPEHEPRDGEPHHIPTQTAQPEPEQPAGADALRRRQRAVEVVRFLREFGREPRIDAHRRAGFRVDGAITPQPAGQQGDGLAGGTAPCQQRTTLAQPPTFVRIQLHSARTHPGNALDLSDVRHFGGLPRPAGRWKPELDALVFANPQQGVTQRRAIVRHRGRRRLQHAEQGIPGPRFALLPMQRLGAQQVGRIHQHEAAVGLLGGKGHAMELGQRRQQQPLGLQRLRRYHLQPGRVEEPQPAMRGDGNVARAVALDLARVKEGHVFRWRLHPHDAGPGRQHVFIFNEHVLAGGEEPLGAGPGDDLAGDGGGDAANPRLNLLHQGFGGVRLFGEHLQGQAPQLRVRQPLADVHGGFDLRLPSHAEDQPPRFQAQHLLEVRRGAILGLLGHEHVHRALDHVPHLARLGEGDGPVAATDEPLSTRQGDFTQPTGHLRSHLRCRRHAQPADTNSWYSPSASCISVWCVPRCTSRPASSTTIRSLSRMVLKRCATIRQVQPRRRSA